MLHPQFNLPRADGTPIDATVQAGLLIAFAKRPDAQAVLSTDEIARIKDHCTSLQALLKDVDVFAQADDEEELLTALVAKYRRSPQPSSPDHAKQCAENMASGLLNEAYAHFASVLPALQTVLKFFTAEQHSMLHNAIVRAPAFAHADFVASAGNELRQMPSIQVSKLIESSLANKEATARKHSISGFFMQAAMLDHEHHKLLVAAFQGLNDEDALIVSTSVGAALPSLSEKLVRRSTKRLLDVVMQGADNRYRLRAAWLSFRSGLSAVSEATRQKMIELIIRDSDQQQRRFILKTMLQDQTIYSRFKALSHTREDLQKTHDMLMVKSLQRHEVLLERFTRRGTNAVQGIETGRSLALRREYETYRDSEIGKFGKSLPSNEPVVAQMEASRAIEHRIDEFESRHLGMQIQSHNVLMATLQNAVHNVVASMRDDNMWMQEAMRSNARQLASVVRSEGDYTRDVVMLGNAHVRSAVALEAGRTRDELGHQLAAVAAHQTRELAATRDVLVHGQNRIVAGINRGAELLAESTHQATLKMNALSATVTDQSIKTTDLYQLVKNLSASSKSESSKSESAKSGGEKKSNREPDSVLSKGNVENLRAAHYLSELGVLVWKIFMGS